MRNAQPAHSILERLGGWIEVAEALNLTRQAVDYWTRPVSRGGSGGRIPLKHHKALVALAQEKGVPLSYEDFHAEGKLPDLPKAGA